MVLGGMYIIRAFPQCRCFHCAQDSGHNKVVHINSEVGWFTEHNSNIIHTTYCIHTAVTEIGFLSEHLRE